MKKEKLPCRKRNKSKGRKKCPQKTQILMTIAGKIRRLYSSPAA